MAGYLLFGKIQLNIVRTISDENGDIDYSERSDDYAYMITVFHI